MRDILPYHRGCIYAAAGNRAGALKQIQVNTPKLQPHLAALRPLHASCAMKSLCINGQKSGPVRMQKGKDESVASRTAQRQRLAGNTGASEDRPLGDKSVHLCHFCRSQHPRLCSLVYADTAPTPQRHGYPTRVYSVLEYSRSPQPGCACTSLCEVTWFIICRTAHLGR